MSTYTLALLERCKAVVARLLDGEATAERGPWCAWYVTNNAVGWHVITTEGQPPPGFGRMHHGYDAALVTTARNMHRPVLLYLTGRLSYIEGQLQRNVPNMVEYDDAECELRGIAGVLGVADDELKNMLEVKE